MGNAASSLRDTSLIDLYQHGSGSRACSVSGQQIN
jgi:hypothetical protein